MKNDIILEKQSIELSTPDAFELSDRLTGRKGIIRANAVTTTLVRVIYNDKIHNDTSIKDMVSKENQTINEGNKLNKHFIVSINEFKKYVESVNDPRTEDKFKSDLFTFLDYPWDNDVEKSIVEELNKDRENYVTANEDTLKKMLRSTFETHSKNINKDSSDLFKFNVKKLTENFNK